MPSSRGSPQPRDRTQVSHIAGRYFTLWATRETHHALASWTAALSNVDIRAFLGGSAGKEPACQCRRHKRPPVQSLGQEDTLRRKWQLVPICLPGKFHGKRSLVGYSPWGCKESDTTEHTNVDITHTISKHHILLTLPVSLEKSLEVSITWWRKQVFQNPNFYFCSRTWILSLAAYTINYFLWDDSLTFLSEESSCQTMPKS